MADTMKAQVFYEKEKMTLEEISIPEILAAAAAAEPGLTKIFKEVTSLLP